MMNVDEKRTFNPDLNPSIALVAKVGCFSKDDGCGTGTKSPHGMPWQGKIMLSKFVTCK